MGDTLKHSEAVKMMNQLQATRLALRQRKAELDPIFYDLPDLLFPREYGPGKLDPETHEVIRKRDFPGETEEGFRARQDEALEDFIKDQLSVVKDATSVSPTLIPEMVDLISDLFYARVRKAILWANRGGGKSLVAAIVIWMIMVYRKKSFVDMAATGEQAKRVYEYTVQFWDCFPRLKVGMLQDVPFIKLTTMKGKTKLICCSGEQAVGEHLPGFVGDEACTDKAQAENNFRRAMQGVFDNEEHLVLLLSTFHHPVGLFQETWDNAEELGYKRYRWSIYDIMAPCKVGLETKTEEDPFALKFCQNECPLTRLEDVKDEHGRKTGVEWKGCRGSARTAQGWQTRNQTLAKFEENKGTRIYQVEHECDRPRFEGQIYNPDLVQMCVSDGFMLDYSAQKVIGIDWGLTQCFMVCVGEWIEGKKRGLGVLATRVMSNKLTAEVVKQILEWQEQYGDEVLIRADHSHPYCNKELRGEGYAVRTVRGDKDKQGEDNAQRWLASGRFRILRECSMLITQLKNLRQDDDGKQIKDNRDDERGDHGPDAMKFALLAFDYTKWLRKHGTETMSPEEFERASRDGNLD